jgi:hypothetical protein
VSTSWNAEVSEKDQQSMDFAEITVIRTWLNARNTGKPYRLADYSIDATLERLRWLLEYAERVGRPDKRCVKRTKIVVDMEHLVENYQVELQRLGKIESRYRALRSKVERSSRWVWSQDGGRR